METGSTQDVVFASSDLLKIDVDGFCPIRQDKFNVRVVATCGTVRLNHVKHLLARTITVQVGRPDSVDRAQNNRGLVDVEEPVLVRAFTFVNNKANAQAVRVMIPVLHSVHFD